MLYNYTRGRFLENRRESDKVRKVGLGIAGQLGMEYRFASIPLGLSLDWRPGFDFVNAHFGWEGFALGVRYTF